MENRVVQDPASQLNPIQAGPPELTIQAGGGQKRLRYIIGPYLSDFKSDFIRVKSKSELHIIRSHLEKKNCKNVQNWTSYRCFRLPFKNSKKN